MGYRGNNDAWDGYGGAVVYTREPAFPKDFVLTDNTCKAREGKLEELEQDLVFMEGKVVPGIQLIGKSVVKEVVKDVVAVEKEIVKDVVKVEKEIVKDVVAVEKEIVKDLGQVEQEVEKDVKGLFGFGKK